MATMPVFLFTIHAYRSWGPDNPRGFVRRGEGILPPDAGLAKAYDQQATDQPASFGAAERQQMGWIIADACTRRDWRLHALAVEPTHAHLLVSWADEAKASAVCGKLKNLISRELNLGLKTKRKWLSRGASRKQVYDRMHFDHLVGKYLPGHRGLFWCEGRQPPWGDRSASADG